MYSPSMLGGGGKGGGNQGKGYDQKKEKKEHGNGGGIHDMKVYVAAVLQPKLFQTTALARGVALRQIVSKVKK